MNYVANETSSTSPCDSTLDGDLTQILTEETLSDDSTLDEDLTRILEKGTLPDGTLSYKAVVAFMSRFDEASYEEQEKLLR